MHAEIKVRSVKIERVPQGWLSTYEGHGPYNYGPKCAMTC